MEEWRGLEVKLLLIAKLISLEARGRLAILQNLKYYSFRKIVFLTFTIFKIVRNYRSFSFKDIVESIRSFFLLLDFLLPLLYT